MQPRGLDVLFRAKVDAYHVGYTVTRRSRTDLLVDIYSNLAYWFSKKKFHREFYLWLRVHCDEAVL